MFFSPFLLSVLICIILEVIFLLINLKTAFSLQFLWICMAFEELMFQLLTLQSCHLRNSSAGEHSPIQLILRHRAKTDGIVVGSRFCALYSPDDPIKHLILLFCSIYHWVVKECHLMPNASGQSLSVSKQTLWVYIVTKDFS